MSRPGGTIVLDVRLKLYFDHDRTLDWCREVRGITAGVSYGGSARPGLSRERTSEVIG
jgi:hypothetical protein